MTRLSVKFHLVSVETHSNTVSNTLGPRMLDLKPLLRSSFRISLFLTTRRRLKIYETDVGADREAAERRRWHDNREDYGYLGAPCHPFPLAFMFIALGSIALVPMILVLPLIQSEHQQTRQPPTHTLARMARTLAGLRRMVALSHVRMVTWSSGHMPKEPAVMHARQLGGCVSVDTDQIMEAALQSDRHLR